MSITSLNEECRDGQILLKIMDKIQPGIVEWNKLEKNPNNAFKKVRMEMTLGNQCKYLCRDR